VTHVGERLDLDPAGVGGNVCAVLVVQPGEPLLERDGMVSSFPGGGGEGGVNPVE
jgi:hypothetical protein